MFTIGSAVRYSSDVPSDWEGSEGVIVEADCPGFGYKEKVHSVNWYTGNLSSYQNEKYLGRGFVRSFENTLRLISFTYDPTQTGDTDDDV